MDFNSLLDQGPARTLGGTALAVMVLTGIILAGCLGSQATGTPAAGAAITPAPGLAATITPATTDTKTGADKVNASIQAAVADGTYTNIVSYAYHSGVDNVNISVTVQKGIITAASVTGIDTDPMSTRIIGNFNNALPSLVVGQPISQINLPHNVAGSSLTSAAFQQYVNGLVQSA